MADDAAALFAQFRLERDRLLAVYRAARALRDARKDDGTDEGLKLEEALGEIEDYWSALTEAWT